MQEIIFIPCFFIIPWTLFQAVLKETELCVMIFILFSQPQQIRLANLAK